jgi:hypothetical protein
MTKKLILAPGDIFEIPIIAKKHYIQYLMNDSTLFNANVVRVFDCETSFGQSIDLKDVVKSRVRFHTHVMIKGGVKLCGWFKIGNIPLEPSFSPPLFRATDDAYADVRKSTNWYVWQACNEIKKIGRLSDKYKNIDYGSVFHPIDVGKWIETDKIGFLFPE